MTISITKIITIQLFLIGACFEICENAKADTSSELKDTLSQLAEINQNILRFPDVAKASGYGQQQISLDQALRSAEASFSHSDWTNTITNTQIYLGNSQTTKSEDWLRAQYLLARSYEERGQYPRAIRTYLRFLSSFTTARNQDTKMLTDVVERLVILNGKSSSKNQEDANNILSSIAAMKVPPESTDDLKYFSALGSNKNGNRALAKSWLNKEQWNSGTIDRTARSLNLKALISMQQANWSEASEILSKIISLENLKSSSKDSARIALARVNNKLGKPKTSLNIYSEIKNDSPVYRDALFEKTFLLIKDGQHSKANECSDEFLTKYPEHPDSFTIRSLKTWLEFKSGNIAAAKENLERSTKSLNEIKEKSREILVGKTKITSLDLKSLKSLTHSTSPPPVELEELLSMFDQINDLSNRLDDANGVVLNVLYSLAKSDLDKFNPELANRRSQIFSLYTALQTIIERHISDESRRLDSLIKSRDREKLDSYNAARRALSSQKEQLKLDSLRYLNWAEPAEQLISLADQWNKLLKVERNRTLVKLSEEKNEQITSDVKIQMKEALTKIKLEQANRLFEQSSLLSFEENSAKYLDNVQAIGLLLGSYEPKDTQLVDSLDDNDAQTIWREIQVAGKSLKSRIKSLVSESKSDLNITIESIHKLTSRNREIQSSLHNLKEYLESEAAIAGPMILAHYDANTELNLIKNQKIAADIDFYKYSEKSKEHSDMRENHSIEIQKLSDGVLNNESGGEAKWQR